MLKGGVPDVQNCAVGHIPLPRIQQALFHPDNRGPDGEAEDLTSAGHSPHKLFLVARRRHAELQVRQPCSCSCGA